MQRHHSNTGVFQAAVFGSVLGSAVTAGIFLLKNKEERDRVFESIDNALVTARTKTKELQSQADTAQDSAEELKRTATKKVRKARKAAEDTVADVTSSK